MATNKPTDVTFDKMAQFDNVYSKIHQIFKQLIDQLVARRDSLLQKVNELREDFINKETTRIAAIKELKEVKQILLDMSIKVNTNKEFHQQATQTYQEGLTKLEPSTTFQCPFFKFQRVERIQTLISELGEIVLREVPDYSLKEEPVPTAGMRGVCVSVLDPMGISFDESAELVYIAELEKSRVQIVSFNGEFVTQFGQDKLRDPWGIAVTKECIFVTDTEQHAVFQFNKKDLKLINRTGTERKGKGQLNYPRGLCIDTIGDVFVADSSNHRVSVFSKNLGFKSGMGIGKLQNPQDVKIKGDCVLVLDWSPKCVHFYSRDGHILSSCIAQGCKQDSLINTPSFFCVDSSGSIIISDNDHHAINIFTKSGHHIHTFGRKGNEKGEFVRPCGVCVSKLGIVFVVSKNSNYSLQSF